LDGFYFILGIPYGGSIGAGMGRLRRLFLGARKGKLVVFEGFGFALYEHFVFCPSAVGQAAGRLVKVTITRAKRKEMVKASKFLTR